jgi:hypothetical protein
MYERLPRHLELQISKVLVKMYEEPELVRKNIRYVVGICNHCEIYKCLVEPGYSICIACAEELKKIEQELIKAWFTVI